MYCLSLSKRVYHTSLIYEYVVRMAKKKEENWSAQQVRMHLGLKTMV